MQESALSNAHNEPVSSRKCSINVGGECEMLHFCVSEHNVAHCAEREDEIWMKRKRGEATRTDIIWRTVSLPALIQCD